MCVCLILHKSIVIGQRNSELCISACRLDGSWEVSSLGHGLVIVKRLLLPRHGFLAANRSAIRIETLATVL